MAKRTITPERGVVFTKRMVAITYCWPLPQTASRAEIIRYQILRFLCVINAAFVLLPLVTTVYLYRNNPVILVKSVCLTSAIIQIIVQTVICAKNYNELQVIVLGLQEYIEDAELWKKKILQQYIERCGKFYAIAMLWIYFTASFIACVPAVVTDQKFPISDEYPFPADFLPLRILLFIHQAFSLFQCAAQVSMNGFIALLLWFAAARFEILSIEMENVTNVNELWECIENQQILLRYAESVIRTIRYISLVAIIASLVSFICNGVTLLMNISFENKCQFAILSVVAVMEVFMLSWPADHLMDASTRLSQGIYGSKWYESSLKVQKTLAYIILRSQKPLVVSIGGVLPPISLNYFASYLSTAFSYFTALRVVVESS